MYCDAFVDDDPELVVDVMMAVAGRMSGEPLGDEARPFVQAMAEEEGRVVLRCRPYSTFAQPPRHLHKNDQEDVIMHWRSNVMAWDAPDEPARQAKALRKRRVGRARYALASRPKALSMTSEATLRGRPLPRPSVRIICLDVDGRVLLLQWQDPVTREHLWEPPGGGIEGDETAFAAAQRELHEETGLDPARIHERSINVERDTTWKGRRYVGAEPFFIAHFDTKEPIVIPAGLSTDEEQNIRRHLWCHAYDFASLDGRLEPPELATVIDQLRNSGSPR